MSEIRRYARAAGRRDVAFESVAFLFCVLDDDFEKALDRAAAALESIYNRPFRDAARKYCFLGRPEDILEQMQGYVGSGARHFVFSMLSDPGEFMDAYRAIIQPGLDQIEL